VGKLTKLEEVVAARLPRFADRRLSQQDIPRLAKDPRALSAIERAVKAVPTAHDLYLQDAREMVVIPDRSVHLIVTSPPYWTLKRYRDHADQLGQLSDYEVFLKELTRVWAECHRVLVEGGRLIVVVGDVCLSRRKHGAHMVVPLHAAIQQRCAEIGFHNLAPIIWYKIANAALEVDNGSSFLGKPYEPNAIIKNDIEFILMQRKPGAYRRPTEAMRLLSLISAENHRRWFNQVLDLRGASTRDHPAPFPLELAERLIRMFSFVGDTVLDPFSGTATTSVAACRWGRNSMAFEVDDTYHRFGWERLARTVRLERLPATMVDRRQAPRQAPHSSS
jgi:DNA modification methylase